MNPTPLRIRCPRATLPVAKHMHLAFDIPFAESHEPFAAMLKLKCPCGSSLVLLEHFYPEPWEDGFDQEQMGTSVDDATRPPVMQESPAAPTADVASPPPSNVAAILSEYPIASHPGVHELAGELALATDDVLAASREAERMGDMHSAFAGVVMRTAVAAMGDHNARSMGRALGDIRVLAADALGEKALDLALTPQLEKGTPFGVSGTHWTIAALAKSLHRSLGEAPNYVEFPITMQVNGDNTSIVIRIERCGGKAPSLLHAEATAALAVLQKKQAATLDEHKRVVIDLKESLAAGAAARASLLADFLAMEDALQSVTSQTSDENLRAMAHRVIMANGTRTKAVE